MNHDNPTSAARLRLLGLTLLCSLLALLFSPALPVQAQSNDAGLVGYWPFDEGSGATSADRSDNGNTATLSAGAGFTTIVAPLALANPAALTFQGSAEASATGNGLDNLQQLTIAAWVRHQGFGGGQRYVTLGSDIAVLRYDAGLHFYLTINDRLVGVRIPISLTPNRYYHVAGTYDGLILRLYLDDDLVGIRGLLMGVVGKGNGLLFSSSHESLDGSLDEVRIYNRALTAAEIGRLAFTCTNVTEIPQSECQALVALYHSTNGAGWGINTHWLTTNTPCGWFGVTCEAGSVTQLSLVANQLSGNIPPELGNLTDLQLLSLHINQLSGAIPSELGNLANLYRLSLFTNQLSGAIPSELGNLTNLQVLDLDSNQLSGNIPAELGNLTSLREFYLDNNQLRGSIPAALCSLPLSFADFGYNKLAASDPCLAAIDPDWAQTQTVPPSAVQAQAFANQQVQLTWTPITYTADGGYYTVVAGVTAGGPYTVVGQTADKTASAITLPAFGPGRHHLIMRTFTPKHGEQQNDLKSDNSTEAVVVFNTPPLAASAQVTATQGRALSILLAANDVDSDPLQYSLVSLPVHGLLSGSAPTLTYTSAAGFIGTDSFTFKANDSKTDSNVATVTIQVVAAPLVNTPPVAHNQTVTTTQGSRIAITLSATDGEGDGLTYQVIIPPIHGSLGGIAPALVYTPTPSYNGADSFTYQAHDGQLDSAPATVQIQVTTQPNRPPTAQDDEFTVTRNSQGNLLAVLTNDHDADGDSLTLAAVAAPLNGTAQIVNGQVRYTPAAEFVGVDRFTYTVSDGKATVVASVSVTVAAALPTTQAVFLPLVTR